MISYILFLHYLSNESHIEWNYLVLHRQLFYYDIEFFFTKPQMVSNENF